MKPFWSRFELSFKALSASYLIYILRQYEIVVIFLRFSFNISNNSVSNIFKKIIMYILNTKCI